MMVLSERVPLLEARPELTRHLTPDERAELVGVTLPVVAAGPGPLELNGLLDKHNSFGATVLDGLVMGSLCVGNQTGTHLLGPGDVLPAEGEVWPAWMGALEFRAGAPVRLGLFGNDLLIALHRSPRAVQGLYASVAEQLHRLSAQLVICQLPRVEDRVLAMLWLLAESWGTVTPGGVRLPLTLTHETLGSLVGARRPTVTLALRKLTDEGALVAQESGWLLLEQPAPQDGTEVTIVPPQTAGLHSGPWAAPQTGSASSGAVDRTAVYSELRDTVRQLRERHRTNREQTQQQLERIRTSRARMTDSRRRIADGAFRRRVPPSS